MSRRTTIHMTQAAMQAALQAWAERTYKRVPRVQQVRTALTSTTLSEEFDVVLIEPDDGEPDAIPPRDEGDDA